MALEPRHGKTATVAYLVGARATPMHALLLGLTMTAMHTSSVFVLGLITLFASQLILPERLLPWLGLASGLLVVGVGVHMFVTRLRATGNRAVLSNNHQGLHTHTGGWVHSHLPGAGHSIPAANGSRTKVGWRGILTIGISGGLLPCPAALIVLLSALGLGRLEFGLLLIVAFSTGLALVLSCLGLAVLYCSRWASRNPAGLRLVHASPAATRLATFLPSLSGLLGIGTGLLLLYHALPLLRVLQ